MTVKELKEELKKYRDETLVFIESGEHCDDIDSFEATGFVEDEDYNGRRGITLT